MNKSGILRLVTLLLTLFALTGCSKTNDEVSLTEDELILMSINEHYQDAKEESDKNEPEKAKEILHDINEGYVNYPIKNDIDILSIQIDEQILKHEDINFELEEADQHIKNQNYGQALLVLSRIDKKTLNEAQKDKILDYYEYVSTATAILDTGRIQVNQ